MDWIKDISKKEQRKAERPARSPERLKNNLKKTLKVELEPVKPGDTQGDFGDVLNNGSKVNEGASKNLKDYDCW